MESEFKDSSSAGSSTGGNSDLNLNQRYRHAGDLTGEPPTRPVSVNFDL